MKRREFLKSASIAALSAAAGGRARAASSEKIPYRTLGRTGARTSVLGIGGAHIGKPSLTDQEGIQIVRTALDSGVNFLDNSWDYNNGDSERRMGMALQDGYRQKAFLMTKIDGRTAALAQQQMEDSLRRLQTDHLDLIQIHEVIRMEDPERVFAPGGAMEYLESARKAGKARFIGFTGHKSPEIHLHMIEVAKLHNFTFDTVQMPLNVMDAHYDSFAAKVIPVARKLNMGILGMKPLAEGAILRSNTVTAPQCLQYAMSLPVTTVITGCDSMKILQQALDVARGFHRLDQTEMASLAAKTAAVAQDGKYEGYKTAGGFDATSRNPHWLG